MFFDLMKLLRDAFLLLLSFNLKEQPVKYCDGLNPPEAADQLDPYSAEAYLKSVYSGCTHVRGHLSIARLGKNADLSFLNTIQEVYGSVFIANNNISVIPLPNLRIIRGSSPYEENPSDKYALFIAKNNGNNSGKAYIDLSSLVSVMNYGILIGFNKNLCYLNTFNWNHLLEHPGSKVRQFNNTPNCNLSTGCSRGCPIFDGKRYCSGPKRSMCQIGDFKGRFCKDTESRSLSDVKCCHKECAGGCTGPTQFECLECRHLKAPTPLLTECVQRCPSTGRNLTFGFMCVERCPMKYLAEETKCVKTCSSNFYPKKDRCVRCTGNICNKVCRIADLTKKFLAEKPRFMGKIYVGGGTPRSVMKKLRNCTIVDGQIMVNTISHSPIILKEEHIRHEDFENLRNIKHINGKLHLNLLQYPRIKSLNFLSNLESMQTPGDDAGMIILYSHLDYLGLVKLRYLAMEEVDFFGNRKLCYLEGFRNRFPKSHLNNVVIRRNIPFVQTGRMKNSNCVKEGKVCDSSCDTKTGCWGPGKNMCF